MLAVEKFVLFGPGGEFLIFGGAIINIFHLHRVYLELKKIAFPSARGELLSKLPVARSSGKRIISKKNTSGDSDKEDDIVKGEIVVLDAEVKSSKLGFIFFH